VSRSSNQLSIAEWSEERQPDSQEDWKQEVNRRLAAHNRRKNLAAVMPATPAQQPRNEVDLRAAQAAARVAARYAKAPSYSEMQASDARAALRAAELATQAALEAQAAAQVVLANLEATGSCEDEESLAPRMAGPSPELKPALATTTIAPAQEPAAKFTMTEEAAPGRNFGIRWDPDMPSPRMAATTQQPMHESRGAEFVTEDASLSASWTASDTVFQAYESASAAIETIEPAQPIYANLIEFPRQLVAARKARPRLAEGPYATTGMANGQLSIFEVDPGAISIEPEPETATTAILPAAPEWSGMELDAQPALDEELLTEELEEAEREKMAPREHAIEVASVNRRFLSVFVDCTLVMGAFLAAAYGAASNMSQLPSLRETETVTILALAVTAILYKTVFSFFAEATPGMKYAGISLCTFDDRVPTRAHRLKRLGALFLSLLPLGLGFAWSIFDEDRLSWHDRLSETYQRRS
jgi:uncharacterized RDD family membrane protein YckC